MKFFWVVLIGVTAGLCPVWSVEIGDTRKQVIEELGEPLGVMGGGERVVLVYDGGTLALVNGVVAEMDEGWERRDAKRKRERAYIEEQTAKGLVFHDGEWMEPEERDGLVEKAKQREQRLAELRAKQRRVQVSASSKGNRGAEIDLNQVLVPGKVTIVDLYADWCGPCKRISPFLHQLANQYDDVELRKVDIVKWGSPVAKQFGLKSIPNIRVYNKQGNMVGTPTSQLAMVKKNVAKAR